MKKVSKKPLKLPRRSSLSSASKRIIRHMSGGEDWFEGYCHVNWRGNFDALAQKLEHALSAARLKGGGGKRVQTLGGRRVALNPSRKSFPQTFEVKAGMRWSLVIDGILILISGQRSYSPARPSLAFVVDGRTCLRYGAEACWNKISAWVESLGGKIALTKVTRVDLCLDLPGQRPDDLFRALSEERVITRSKHRRIAEQGSTKTVYVGSSPLELSVYDKLAQVRAKRSDETRELMIARRWNGHLPRCATRVEFRLRAKALRARGICTVGDYLKHRAHLTQHLTTKSFRFVQRRLSKGHQHRSPVLPLWKAIQQGFEKWAGAPSGPAPKPVTAHVGNENLFRQMAGVAFSAAARAGVSTTTQAEFESFVLDGLRHEIEGTDLTERIEHKRLELGLPVKGSPTPDNL